MRKLKQLAELMNELPEVRWDRLTRSESYISIFGWIDRGDGKVDFAILHSFEELGEWLSTSSAELAEDFGRRLGCDPGAYNGCERVEQVFKGLVNNVIHLEKS